MRENDQRVVEGKQGFTSRRHLGGRRGAGNEQKVDQSPQLAGRPGNPTGAGAEHLIDENNDTGSRNQQRASL